MKWNAHDAAPDQWPLSRAALADLPPARLANYRTERYGGGALAVPLTTFAAADQATVRALYRVLRELWTVLTTAPPGETTMRQAVRQFVTHSDWPAVLQAVQHIGAGSRTAELGPVIHDLRGGSFTALVGALALVTQDRLAEHATRLLVVLVRDHLHTLRSLIPDLDIQGAHADYQPQLQPVERLIEKWHHVPYAVGNTAATVHLDVQDVGAVAARPSELTTMDGVLTNLVNNAVRFTADGAVYLVMLPHATARDVRCVVYNRLAAEQHATLRARFAADWRGLFAGGFTTGGTGLGLRICAAYIAECYGLASVKQGVEAQYIAAQIIDDAFVAWFHWPLAASRDSVEPRG